MEYSIVLKEYATQTMIHTSIAGTLSEKARNEIGVETVRMLRAHQVSKVIWDIREAKLDYPLIYSHQVVLNLAALGLQRGDYVAVIYFYDQEQHQHASNVAFNRGILNIGYFLKMEDGIQWLIGKGAGVEVKP